MNTNATKQGAGRKVKPVGKGVALTMLESALAYCQESGIEVDVARILSGLPGVGANTIDGQTQFFLAEPTTIMANATQPVGMVEKS